MNTRDIESILGSDGYTLSSFLGALSRDEFEHLLYNRPRDKDYAVVFNSHTSDLPGEHWMGFYCRGGEGFYFDSYGRHPSVYKDLHQALRYRFNKVHWNDIRLQGVTSNTCGDYSVMFCLFMARGWKFKRFIDLLLMSGDNDTRDHSARTFTLKNFGPDALHIFRERNAELLGDDKLHIDHAVITHFLNSSILTSCFV
jgi:hypothetical protein